MLSIGFKCDNCFILVALVFRFHLLLASTLSSVMHIHKHLRAVLLSSCLVTPPLLIHPVILLFACLNLLNLP